MASDRASGYAKHVETLFVAGALGDLGDAQLLDRFLEHARDARAAEMAFAALVERHAPMVLRVCAGVLGDVHDAQDVSQATFLVLAQRASSVRRRGSVASWLHGVALRLASKVKRGAARRRSHEQRGGEIMTARRVAQGGSEPAETWKELHEELERLPERFREPIVLCHIEGLTQEQAAHRLGWPIGTVQSRLARGRDRLRVRLVRRGVTLSAATFATGFGAAADAAVTATWVETTARAAVQIVAGRSIAGSVPASVLLLWQAGSRSLGMSRLLIAGGVAVAIGTLAAGTGVLGWAAPGWRRRDGDQVRRSAAHAGGPQGPDRGRSPERRTGPLDRGPLASPLHGRERRRETRGLRRAESDRDHHAGNDQSSHLQRGPVDGDHLECRPRGWADRYRHIRREQAGPDYLPGEPGLLRGAEGWIGCHPSPRPERCGKASGPDSRDLSSCRRQPGHLLRPGQGDAAVDIRRGQGDRDPSDPPARAARRQGAVPQGTSMDSSTRRGSGEYGPLAVAGGSTDTRNGARGYVPRAPGECPSPAGLGHATRGSGCIVRRVSRPSSSWPRA